MPTLLYVPLVFFFLYGVIELGTRMAWIHTPHFTNLKAAILTVGTLLGIFLFFFTSMSIPAGTLLIRAETYEGVALATYTFFAILTLVYIFEWIKDHRVALLIERSYFRRWYEYAEAQARWLVASPLMILIAIAALILTICSMVLTQAVFGF